MKKAILLILGISAVIYCRIQSDRLYIDATEQATTEYGTNERLSADGWTIISDDVTATVYNACRDQCNSDYRHTASMFSKSSFNSGFQKRSTTVFTARSASAS